jgi:phospholipase C
MAPIKHLFVLMLENRSFDHMLGFASLQGIVGTKWTEDSIHDPEDRTAESAPRCC